MKLSSKITFVGAATILVVAFNNCSQVEFTPIDAASSVDLSGNPVTPIPEGSAPTPLQYKMIVTPSQGFVCSPFGSTTVPSDKSGLKAELRYIPQDSSLSTSAKNAILSKNYFNDASTDFVKAPQALYLQDVNVPTRKFEQGFTNSTDGSLLKDDKGNVLVEYFALKMESVLKLGPNDAVGFYEIATISDDGTVVEIKENGMWSEIISNDGAHSAKMGCASRKIYMDKQTRLPIRIYYNQGPRTEIANVLVWNFRGPGMESSPELSSDQDVRKHCGKSSGSDFWRSSDSAQGPLVTDLFDKKWKVLSSANFQLPDNEVNPCSFNNYDIAPELKSDDLKNFDLSLKESAAVEVKVYKIEGSSKMLVQNVVKPADVRHSFQITAFDVNNIYKLEMIATIDNKQLKVLKDYEVKFVKE